MNIFATDPYPEVAAQHLCDIHLRSQLGESTRIMTTALHRLGAASGYHGIGRPYNPHGRFAKWASSSSTNFLWLWDYTKHLQFEYLLRFGKYHMTRDEFMGCLKVATEIFGVREMSRYNPMPETFERCERTRAMATENTHLAYKQLLLEKYKEWGQIRVTYTVSKVPDFIRQSNVAYMHPPYELRESHATSHL